MAVALLDLSTIARRPIPRLIAIVTILALFVFFFVPNSLESKRFANTPYVRPPFFPDHPPHERPQRHGHLRPPHPHAKHPHGVDTWATRADAVKDAFLHAYGAYREHASGHDEVLPLTNGSVDSFNGWGLTVVESLDTMWLMGLRSHFDEAIGVVANMTFHLEPHAYAPFFETIIRYLGGLLSAYALSGDSILLARADDLGSMMLPALETRSGLPIYAVNTVSGKTKYGWTSGKTLWAEALSCQLEYKYLAYLTGRKPYYRKVEDIMQIMYAANLTKTQDLFPTVWDTVRGTPTTDVVSVGAFADSAYEYMLKQWLLTGRSDTQARNLYVRSANAIISHLLFLTPNRRLLYVTDLSTNKPTHTFEHLSCFLPGVLALGAKTLPADALSPHERARHLAAAQGLAQTCWALYADAQTGLAPDEVVMHRPAQNSSTSVAGVNMPWEDAMDEWDAAGRGGAAPGTADPVSARRLDDREYDMRKRSWLLRPEAVESFYVLWRVTGDVRWRERGWAVFEAMEKTARVAGGYASVMDVDDVERAGKNEMPSYFLAETLKYLYLLFTDEELIPLDRWVFNTEAHPLPVFEWTDWEREMYGINSMSI
ncbi:glycoside hydrolase family 47 protein [Auriscalpium vulgare]|uniref:Glycoside hydrolase family 47 protein n=1 Tax=Auriscalpium vulgare TaxID=40419 RepID=A0ACB8RQR1_9AGAM|nr:glycoside hydrolase family 47 protein [Auriscalpium vulgare]